MPNYRKRKETDYVNAILDFLQVLENLGKIARYDRINSGKVTVGLDRCPKCGERIGKSRKFRGARKGTSDIIILLWNGKMIWLEVKTPTGTQEDSQKDFQKLINMVENHFYYVVITTDDVIKILKKHQVEVYG